MEGFAHMGHPVRRTGYAYRIGHIAKSGRRDGRPSKQLYPDWRPAAAPPACSWYWHPTIGSWPNPCYCTSRWPPRLPVWLPLTQRSAQPRGRCPPERWQRCSQQLRHKIERHLHRSRSHWACEARSAKWSVSRAVLQISSPTRSSWWMSPSLQWRLTDDDASLLERWCQHTLVIVSQFSVKIRQMTASMKRFCVCPKKRSARHPLLRVGVASLHCSCRWQIQPDGTPRRRAMLLRFPGPQRDFKHQHAPATLPWGPRCCGGNTDTVQSSRRGGITLGQLTWVAPDALRVAPSGVPAHRGVACLHLQVGLALISCRATAGLYTFEVFAIVCQTT